MALIDYGYDELSKYLINKDFDDGYHTLRHYYNGAAVDIDAQIITITGNTVYSTNPTLGDTTADATMLMLRYDGDLTINSEVTLTPRARKKGMMIFVNGNCTVNGKISMTARGAIAAGQNIGIFRDPATLSYYSIPAVGGAAYPTRSYNGGSGSYYQAGFPGYDGTNGATGGGGGGGARTGGPSRSAYGGLGSAGTSYSGGSGGGGGCRGYSGSPIYGGNAAANGGAGGAAVASDCIDWVTIGGGAGNPGGARYACNSSTNGSTGTGGLLILLVAGTLTIGSTGVIEAKGSNGGEQYGGGSGGGSVNIFANDIINKGTVTAAGGAGGTRGGKGGDGTVRLITTNVIEYLSLFKYNGKYYSVNGSNALVDIGIPSDRNPTAEEFKTYGFTISGLAPEVYDNLTSDFDVVTWVETLTSNNDNIKTKINAIPQGKFVVHKQDFKIDGEVVGFNMQVTKDLSDVIKIILSDDNGTTWKYYRNGTIGTVNINDIDDIKNNGMEPTEFNNITQSEWAQIILSNSIRFGYYIEQGTSGNSPVLNSIKINKQAFISSPKLNSISIDYETIDEQYYGMLFMDDNLQYYSTGTGEILKKLNVGSLIATNSSNPIKVTVTNSYNFNVDNIVIYPEENIFDVDIELSKTLDPFIAEKALLYDQIMHPNEKIDFYIRIKTGKEAFGNSNFKIKVRAEVN